MASAIRFIWNDLEFRAKFSWVLTATLPQVAVWE